MAGMEERYKMYILKVKSLGSKQNSDEANVIFAMKDELAEKDKVMPPCFPLPSCTCTLPVSRSAPIIEGFIQNCVSSSSYLPPTSTTSLPSSGQIARYL